jgi:hypothetical protein
MGLERTLSKAIFGILTNFWQTIVISTYVARETFQNLQLEVRTLEKF